jgi:hypothetical protein
VNKDDIKKGLAGIARNANKNEVENLQKQINELKARLDKIEGKLR